MVKSINPRPGQKIGLIGGLAPRAGIYYYEQLLHRYAALNRPAEIMLNHADVQRVLAGVNAGDTAGLGNYLGSLANALFDGGASVVAITAVAPHLGIDAIKRAARGPVVNVLDSIAVGVAESGMERMAVFGNRTVIETSIFGAIPQRKVVELQDWEIDVVHRTYTDIALNGKRGTVAEAKLLSAMAQDLIGNRGAQAVVLAGTDLSAFYADAKPDFSIIDVAQLHIEAILQQVS